MNVPANLAQPVDVLAVLAMVACWLGEDGNPTAALSEARAAVAELLEADREHDAARDALIELNRRIAEHGWIDIEHDALRVAGQRFVAAQVRRAAALAALGGAK